MQAFERGTGVETGESDGRGAEVQLDQGGNRHKNEQAEHADREDPGIDLAKVGDPGYFCEGRVQTEGKGHSDGGEPEPDARAEAAGPDHRELHPAGGGEPA